MYKYFVIVLIIFLSVACSSKNEPFEPLEKSRDIPAPHYDQPRWLELINSRRDHNRLDTLDVQCAKYDLEKSSRGNKLDARMTCQFNQLAFYKTDYVNEVVEYLVQEKNVPEEDVAERAITEICHDNEVNAKSFYTNQVRSRLSNYIKTIEKICHGSSKDKLKLLSVVLRDNDQKTCRVKNNSWSTMFVHQQNSNVWLNEDRRDLDGCYRQDTETLRKIAAASDDWVYEKQNLVVGEGKLDSSCWVSSNDKGLQRYMPREIKTRVADCEFIVQ